MGGMKSGDLVIRHMVYITNKDIKEEIIVLLSLLIIEWTEH